jgi:hypothetical protein
MHLWQLLAETGLSFQPTRPWKASSGPEYEVRAARALELYAAPPCDGPAISFDQIGSIRLKPVQAVSWRPLKLPDRLRATYKGRHGIRYIFGVLDVTATGSTPACDHGARAATCSGSCPPSALSTRGAA